MFWFVLGGAPVAGARPVGAPSTGFPAVARTRMSAFRRRRAAAVEKKDFEEENDRAIRQMSRREVQDAQEEAKAAMEEALAKVEAEKQRRAEPRNPATVV